jgi:hypothetical protein
MYSHRLTLTLRSGETAAAACACACVCGRGGARSASGRAHVRAAQSPPGGPGSRAAGSGQRAAGSGPHSLARAAIARPSPSSRSPAGPGHSAVSPFEYPSSPSPPSPSATAPGYKYCITTGGQVITGILLHGRSSAPPHTGGQVHRRPPHTGGQVGRPDRGRGRGRGTEAGGRPGGANPKGAKDQLLGRPPPPPPPPSPWPPLRGPST